ncbi:hypothetical protein ABT354_01475 [Streptomyces sp. NPDC000594]|uniref:hypothetical protein n=1 Tax=Streptomyces sp. NPDC000594 TaxID=3154261 RepID=UPI00331AF477
MHLVTALLILVGTRESHRTPEPGELAEIMRSFRRPRAAGDASVPAHLHTVAGSDRVHAALFMETVDPVDAEGAAFGFLAGVLACCPPPVGWALAAFGRVELTSDAEPRSQETKCQGKDPPCP